MSREARLTREVVEIVAAVAEVAPEAIAADASLEQLGVDSLDGLRIVAAVEKKYGVVIGEAEIAKIRSMPDILELVRRHAPDVE